MNDADTNSINWTAVSSTVEYQDKLIKETVNSSTPRLSSEKMVYRIEGYITFFKRENDQDLLLIFVGKDSSMVIEIPSPDCPEVQGTSRALIFAEEREWVRTEFGTATKFKAVNPPRLSGLPAWSEGHGCECKGDTSDSLDPER